MGNNDAQQCRGSQDCHAKNHICQIIIQKDLGRIKELVKDSRFYCKNCGRAAHSEENLCNPSKI
ncbi:MAG: hypothetical protein A2Y42_00100 [Omnitrophica WOR_2 bacterium GWB2_45_9]|nr:MAG: hypothetical protein A2Y42_00100 [Omnitrophica WOR_2 bacterium GWB2_45_9]OGX48893.1 MAG: hypothetical protein A2216_02265 [Omnitrophica WOR_2 bacterium RIFOXYA2_FULL_45_12]OGX53468.1 MAG: hypothetical protein A2321_04955 [Omnitrophica WOR_2 bacterium RIFOXYB2_FULL_45_11]